MNSDLEFLKAEIEKEQTDLERAEAILADAGVRKEKAQSRLQRLQGILVALELSLQEKKTPSEQERPNSKQTRTRGAVLILAEEGLRHHGPMSNLELQEYLEKRGHSTTGNSINTSLHRLRPERFNKNKDGKWYLVGETLDDQD